ncbi:MAG: alpha/beta hydrolase [Flavobacterium sp.]
MIRHFTIFLIAFMVLGVKAQEGYVSKNVSSFTLHSPQLGKDKKIWVYLPNNYASTKKSYPAIYMHDGQNLFDAKTSAYGEWDADRVLDSLQAEVIVIGIEHGKDKRIEELTPYPHLKHGGGGADKYLEFIVKTLKPYVDDNYRTKKSRKSTVIWGSSLGGLVSYYAILKYPDVFGKAGVFSPSFWYTDDIYKLTETIPKIKGKIYFMAGDSESEDMVADLLKMEKLLQYKKPAPKMMIKISKGGKHNEKLWDKEFAEAYLWLMGN